MKSKRVVFFIMLSLVAVYGFCSGAKDREIERLNRENQRLEQEITRILNMPHVFTTRDLDEINSTGLESSQLTFYLSHTLYIDMRRRADSQRVDEESGVYYRERSVNSSTEEISYNVPGTRVNDGRDNNIIEVSFVGNQGNRYTVQFTSNPNGSFTVNWVKDANNVDCTPFNNDGWMETQLYFVIIDRVAGQR
jgi:hypothetical protein